MVPTSGAYAYKHTPSHTTVSHAAAQRDQSAPTLCQTPHHHPHIQPQPPATRITPPPAARTTAASPTRRRQSGAPITRAGERCRPLQCMCGCPPSSRIVKRVAHLAHPDLREVAHLLPGKYLELGAGHKERLLLVGVDREGLDVHRARRLEREERGLAAELSGR